MICFIEIHLRAYPTLQLSAPVLQTVFLCMHNQLLLITAQVDHWFYFFLLTFDTINDFEDFVHLILCHGSYIHIYTYT